MNSSPIASLIAHGVGHDGVAQVLGTVRKHLGMEVAFVAHFREADRVFEYVDSDGDAPIRQGQAIPLENGYCLKIVRGELPELIPDTSVVPAAMALPETQLVPIGAHLSVPIYLSNGEIYGTLCCFSRRRHPTLGDRDMRLMRALGEVLASRIDENLKLQRVRERASDEIRQAMAAGAPTIVCQPIYSIADETMAGVECLSRFDVSPARTPVAWFSAAHDAGLGAELELRAVQKALATLEHLPAPRYLSVNGSPDLIRSGRLETALAGLDASRLVIEITEHATVPDYQALLEALAPLRARGARLAIDDTGAGYASMRHILDLKADVIKLDMSLTRHIDRDASRRALAKGLIAFAHEIGSIITAEGVESAAELAALSALGVDQVQGYYLGRPKPLGEVLGDAASGMSQRNTGMVRP